MKTIKDLLPEYLSNLKNGTSSDNKEIEEERQLQILISDINIELTREYYLSEIKNKKQG